MGSVGTTQAVRILVASVALLLSAGALSATVVDSPPSTSNASGQPAGGPEVVQSAVPDDTTTSTTVVVGPTTTSPSSTILATTTTRRPSTATAAKSVATSTVASTRPPIRTIETTPNVPPATSWQAGKNGVSARMRIEPASPIAGQPVRFVIDVSSTEVCCLILVHFGEGPATASNLPEVCSGTEPLSTGSSTFETTHAYAAPGAYRATLSVSAGDPCPQTAPPGGRVGTSDVIIEACFAVGPGTAGQAGCKPRLGAH